MLLLTVLYMGGFLLAFDDAARCFKLDPDKAGVFNACLVIGATWPVLAFFYSLWWLQVKFRW
jgi:hypothetical protein